MLNLQQPAVYRQYFNTENGTRVFLIPRTYEANVSFVGQRRLSDMPDDVDDNGHRQEYYYEPQSSRSGNPYVKTQNSAYERAMSGNVQVGNTWGGVPQPQSQNATSEPAADPATEAGTDRRKTRAAVSA